MKKLFVILFSISSLAVAQDKFFRQNYFSIETVDIVGDSRAAQSTQGGVPPPISSALATLSVNWLNQANDMLGHAFRLAGNYGEAGFRSDQWSYDAVASGILSDTAQLVVMSPGCANDNAQSVAGYTTLQGTPVTTANVAVTCVTNEINLASQLIVAGKRVIMMGEYASNGYTGAQFAAVIEENTRLRGYCTRNNGVVYFDTANVMWNPTATLATITFKTGYSNDNTHPNALGSFYIAQALKTTLQSIGVVSGSVLPSAYTENSSVSPICLMTSNMTLFNTLTGGTKSGLGTLTGNVPAGMGISIPLATTSVTITSTSDAGGYGNDVTLAISGSAADTVIFFYSPGPTALVSPSNVLQMVAQFSVAAGSSLFTIPYLELDFTTDVASSNAAYDLFPILGIADAGPTIAYTMVEQTPQLGGNSSVAPPTSVTSVSPRMNFHIGAGGSGTVTISRFDVRKVL